MSATARLLVAARPLTVPRVVGLRAPAVTAIAVTTAVLLAVTPGLVPAESHHHVSWLLATGYGWGALATGCVVLTPVGPGHARWTTAVVAVWLATLAGGPFFPATDAGLPPLLVIGPPVAALLTGILSLHQAGKARG